MKPLVAPAESGEATARHLISTPKRIFDEAAVSAALKDVLDGLTDPAEIQAAAVAVLQDAQKNGRAEIARAFAASPFNARPMTSAYCYLTDQLVRTTLQIAGQRLHPIETLGPNDRLAVIGVGGYGRGEMAPYSDVDLLFLIPQTPSQRTENLIESMLYMLWDLKLKVGHSTRTIRDCVTLGREDFTIQTALLEHRFIAADVALAQDLDETLKTDLFAGTGRSFIEAKLEERDARHRKQGLRYVVEPNVKEAKGGLRDLQSLFWIAKHIYSVEHAADLVDRGVFLEEEFKTFVAAENFLWAVRGHLHLISGRATEQLTFDMQVAVAEAAVGAAAPRPQRAAQLHGGGVVVVPARDQAHVLQRGDALGDFRGLVAALFVGPRAEAEEPFAPAVHVAVGHHGHAARRAARDLRRRAQLVLALGRAEADPARRRAAAAPLSTFRPHVAPGPVCLLFVFSPPTRSLPPKK